MRKKIVFLVVSMMLVTSTVVFYPEEYVKAADGFESWWNSIWAFIKKIS
jgi:hypothetical protein